MELKYKSYNEIPLKTFNEIMSINEDNEIDYEISILSILADCSIDDILNLNLTDYQHIRKQAQFLASFPSSISYAPDNLVINDTKYTVCKNLKQITAAQYIDYQHYIKMEEKKYELLLSCFLIPEGKKYNEGYDMEEVIKDILDLDIVNVLNICFFFLNLFLTSTKVMVNYWVSKLKKMKRKERNPQMKQKIQETLQQILLIQDGIGLV